MTSPDTKIALIRKAGADWSDVARRAARAGILATAGELELALGYRETQS